MSRMICISIGLILVAVSIFIYVKLPASNRPRRFPTQAVPARDDWDESLDDCPLLSSLLFSSVEFERQSLITANMMDADEQEALTWNNEKITRVIRHSLFEPLITMEESREAAAVKSLREKTHSVAMEILADPELFDRLITPFENAENEETPFQTICHYLSMGTTPPPESVELLVPFLHSSSENARWLAAMVIAKTGAASITPHLKFALASDEDAVRSSVITGLIDASESNILAEKVKLELYDDLLNLIRQGRNAFEASVLLVDCDRDRAITFFQSSEVLNVTSTMLSPVLWALELKKILVPRDDLLRLIADFEQGEHTPESDQLLGTVLILLGDHRRKEDHAVLRTYMQNENSSLAENAAEGLLHSHGTSKLAVLQFLSELGQQSEFKNLTQAQRNLGAARECNFAMNSNGPLIYLENCCGNRWLDAIRGFTAMNSTERLKIIRATGSPFPHGQPPADRRSRIEQLRPIASQYSAEFERMRTDYLQCKEVFEVLAAEYIIANLSDFQ